MVQIPLDYLNLVLAIILPMLTALVTARFANSAIKAITLIALTVISTALQQIFSNNGSFAWRAFVFTTVFQFLLSVGAHFGILKPTAITGDNGVVANTVPQGLGGSGHQPATVGPIDD